MKTTDTAAEPANAIKNEQATELKVWNQSIKIEIEVDMIADKLKQALKADHPHANLLTNTIIGLAVTRGDLTYVYNALNGYNNDIDFTVGQFVAYKGNQTMNYAYKLADKADPGEADKFVRLISSPIIGGRIKEVNAFRQGDKVLVSYYRLDEYGKPSVGEAWVSHRELTLIEEDNATMMNAINWDYLEKYK